MALFQARFVVVCILQEVHSIKLPESAPIELLGTGAKRHPYAFHCKWLQCRNFTKNRLDIEKIGMISNHRTMVDLDIEF
jgi:hypothetical protein